LISDEVAVISLLSELIDEYGTVNITSLVTVSSIVDVIGLLLWKNVIKLVYVVKYVCVNNDVSCVDLVDALINEDFKVRVIRIGSRIVKSSVFISSSGVIVELLPLNNVAKYVSVE